MLSVPFITGIQKGTQFLQNLPLLGSLPQPWRNVYSLTIICVWLCLLFGLFVSCARWLCSYCYSDHNDYFFPLFVVFCMLRRYTSCFDLIYQLFYLTVLPFDSSSWHPGIILFLVSLFSVYAPGFARFGVLLQFSRIAKLIAGKFLNDLKQLKPFKESSVDWRHSLSVHLTKTKLFLSFV